MGARIDPAMKAMRQPLSSPRKFNRPLKIPLIPAIRPVRQHQQDGGKPNQSAADRGRYGSEIGHDYFRRVR